MTITHDALDLTVEPLPILHRVPPRYWRLVAKTGNLLKLVNLRVSSPVLTSGDWLLKYIRWESRWYASYWNAFLF